MARLQIKVCLHTDADSTAHELANFKSRAPTRIHCGISALVKKDLAHHGSCGVVRYYCRMDVILSIGHFW